MLRSSGPGALAQPSIQTLKNTCTHLILPQLEVVAVGAHAAHEPVQGAASTVRSTPGMGNQIDVPCKALY